MANSLAKRKRKRAPVPVFYPVTGPHEFGNEVIDEDVYIVVHNANSQKDANRKMLAFVKHLREGKK